MMELINNRGMRDWMIFIKVAEVGNLSRAARELDISISAVSKSLSRLENSIEVTLLRRDSHHLELTGAGQTAYASMKRITSSFQSLLDELRNPDKIIRGSIKFRLRLLSVSFLPISGYGNLQLAIRIQKSTWIHESVAIFLVNPWSLMSWFLKVA